VEPYATILVADGSGDHRITNHFAPMEDTDLVDAEELPPKGRPLWTSLAG